MASCNCDSCPVRPPGTSRSRGWWRRVPLAAWVFLAVAAGTLVLSVLDARAEVYHSRESALQLAFPDADSVSTRTLTLGEEQIAVAAELAGASLPSRLVRVYEAWVDGAVVARGIIDTHEIRSLPETLLVVADTSGRVEAVHLLAFHEPIQYRPTEQWFSQFEGRALDRDLAVRRGIDGVAGATMTSNAVTAAVRRCLATLRVAFGETAAQLPTEPGRSAVGK